MAISEQEQRIFAKVLQMLGSGQPTVQHLDDYIVGHAVLGRLCATQQGVAEGLEAQRKTQWAQAFADAKTPPKMADGSPVVAEWKAPSDRTCEAIADLAVAELRTREVREREKLTMLRNTKDSVWEAINAIKYLGRQGG